VIAALVMLRPLRPGTRQTRAAGGVRAGLRYAASRQQLWLPLVMMALVGLLAFNFPVILPVLASQTFRGNGGTYGLLYTMLSVGSVAGSLGVGFIRHPRRPYLTAALAFGVFLAATAGAPDVAVACLTLPATGAAAFSFVTLSSTALQLHSSPAYRGRIMALWVYVYIGTSPVGSIITGAIISAAGARAALRLKVPPSFVAASE
jgi:MFS family permease